MARPILTRGLVGVIALISVNLLLFQWFASQLSELHDVVYQLESSSSILKQDVAQLKKAQRLLTNSNNYMHNDLLLERNNDVKKLPTTTTLIHAETNSNNNNNDNIKLLPIVVFCYNRPLYLNRTLSTLFKRMTMSHLHPIIVSQDGTDKEVAQVAQSFPINQLIQRVDRSLPPLDKGPAKQYYHIALHYKYGLDKLFDAFPHADGVIILEEDLEISNDALEYFRASLALMRRDPTLWVASAWNDNGHVAQHANASALHRSDFFPGLGWLLTRELWRELAPKWPVAFWDDWMRLDEQRQSRASIRPEVSRTHTFGAQGASGGQFYSQFLKGNQLSSESVAWQQQDLSYLERDNYDAWLDATIAAATAVPRTARIEQEAAKHSGAVLKVLYSGFAQFKPLAKQLAIMNDEKSGVPRTSYRGVVMLRIDANNAQSSNLILLIDSKTYQPRH